MEPWCETCESNHNPKQAHRFTARPVSLGAYTPGSNVPVATAGDLAKPTVTTSTRTLNRRSRKDYNAYMVQYMKAYRARKRERQG